METFENINLTRNGAILEIEMDRPKANAISAAYSRDLGRVFAMFRDDADLRVAILTGAGAKFFTGGWDLNGVADGEEYVSDFGVGGFCGFTEMHDLLKPVICAVNGLAVGAGFEMLLRADFILAADHAQFFLPEVHIGVAPDIATILLPKYLPRPLAMEVLMTGRRLSAQEMLQYNLINKVVAPDQLMAEARALAQQLLKAAPLSLAAIKEGVRETDSVDFRDSYRALKEGIQQGKWPHFKKMLESSDATEGAKAFQEGREPKWTGA